MNLTNDELNRWKEHVAFTQRNVEVLRSVCSNYRRYEINIEYVGLVLEALRRHRFSVLKIRNLRRYIGNVGNRWMINGVVGALIDAGFVEVYSIGGSHCYSYRRLFDLEDIPDVIREVCF